MFCDDSFPRRQEDIYFDYRSLSIHLSSDRNAYCFAPEPARSIGMCYLAFWFPTNTPLKDAGFRVQWKTKTGWQVVKSRSTITCTGGRLAALARMDSSLSVPRDVCRYLT